MGRRSDGAVARSVRDQADGSLRPCARKGAHQTSIPPPQCTPAHAPREIALGTLPSVSLTHDRSVPTWGAFSCVGPRKGPKNEVPKISPAFSTRYTPAA